MGRLEMSGETSWPKLCPIKKNLLPAVPSDFLACHHFPCLSRISRISPFTKDSSVGSSVDAVS